MRPVLAPKELLILRCKVARLGERDVFHWWESEAATPDGADLLQRLFPRTFQWVGLEMAMEAARARHAAFLPGLPAVTLFDLGGQWEAAVEEVWLRAKLAGRQPASVDWSVANGARSSVTEVLAAMDIAPREAIERLLNGRVELADRSVCLGEVTARDISSARDLEPIVQNLAAGYCFSQPRRLVVPYYRLVG